MDKEETGGWVVSVCGNWRRSFLISLPMMALTFPILYAGNQDLSDPVNAAAMVITFLFLNLLFFLMIFTGRTDRFRAIGFVSFAVLLSLSLVSNLIELRGSMTIPEAAEIQCEVPFCHIVIPMTLIPMVLTKSIIFPGQINEGLAPIAGMFVVLIGSCLALGRGFCGWGCFFGGWDDGFSRIPGKRLIRKIKPVWTYLPFAVLLVVVLTSAIMLAPTYCIWLCPFKTVTEFSPPTSPAAVAKMIVFLSLFIGLVVVLPLLTKRRTQCGLFCPMGALLSFANKFNVYDIRIDKANCINCGLCIQICPTLSLTENSLEHGKTRLTCVKCGKCVDICPRHAVYYHIRGTPVSGNREIGRMLFVFSAFFLMACMASVTFQDAISRIIRLIATGHMTG